MTMSRTSDWGIVGGHGQTKGLQILSSLEGTERYQVNFVLSGGFSCRCRKLSAQRQSSGNRSEIVVYDALSVTEMRVIQTGGWEGSARWKLFYILRSLEPILYGQTWNMWTETKFANSTEIFTVYLNPEDRGMRNSVKYFMTVDWKNLNLILAYLNGRMKKNTSIFINKLRHHLEIKNVTCKGMFLGIKIIQDKEGISLQQSHYVQQILQKYGMENCKENPTPGSKEINLNNHIEDDNCDQHTYQEALGMLMFLAVNTRPIAYITSKLSQYSRQPKQMHWTAVKRVMRYLRGTIDLGVKFERGKTGILKSYTDASWSTTHDGKSYGRYVLKLGEATIDWKSSKQPLVALSTMEAEMIAACESCCQIKWIINLLRELEEWNFMEKPTAIYTDSQSLINWISSPKQSSRCRHINRKYHFLRDCYESRDNCLLYNPSQDLEADIFTKDLSRDQIKKHLENLSIVGIKTKITASSPTTSEVSFASSSHHRTVKLPKIELKKFTGEIKDWLGWWAQFNKIHVDPTLEDSYKFQYLVQSMSPGTRASKLVDSYPLTAENYPKVIETLTERFGRPELLQQVYVRDLIRLMLDYSSKQQLKVTSFYDELVTHLRALESLKIEARQMSVFIFPMIEACLSEELMKAWQRSTLHDVKIDANDSTQTRVELIMEFLQKEAAAEQDRALAGSKFGLRSLKQDRNVGRQSHPAKIPTASGLFAGRAQNCIFCNKDHKNTECLAARRMSIKERRERIKNAKCCFSCLQPGHISSNCRRRIPECIRCKKKHLDILCPLNAPGRESADEDKEQVEDCDVSSTVENGVLFSRLSASSLILLQTLKIKVEGATSAKVVRALLDTGSQRSYIFSKTAQDLGLSPIGQESLKHVVFGGHTSESVHQEYRVNLGHASGNFKMAAKLLDQQKICGNLPRLSRGPWLKELKARRIWVPDIGKDDMEIEILLGCDVLGSIFMMKSCVLSNGLNASQTRFGWTLMGECQPGSDVSLAHHVTTMTISESSITNLWNLDGPNLIEMIPNLMLRFRIGKFGVVADIKKAFLQIEVNERDRDYLRFLWPKIILQKVWIKRDNQLGTFVGNRVKEICKLSDPGNWRYVPRECNPADLPSRGCSLSRLIQSRWYKNLNEEEICAERKKIAVVTTVKSTDHWYMKYFSSFIKNVRMMAWIRRIINNLRSSTKVKGELSVKEIDEVELALLKLVQAECFPSHSIPGLKVEVTRRNGEGRFLKD
ncbi:hypothetical protein LAZ67_12002228 [Cordylochernes scorpioides]|uniref:CCHC-type domain-containing protein n=1 Tax=Cordylochernes scorpioides TaxID=51811 RepID=A0ABY6L438_9ARAC|nr:hypothetical protein LAZ67_12002228 [Cordylochernes scorpioides]